MSFKILHREVIGGRKWTDLVLMNGTWPFHAINDFQTLSEAIEALETYIHCFYFGFGANRNAGKLKLLDEQEGIYGFDKAQNIPFICFNFQFKFIEFENPWEIGLNK